MLLSRGLSNNKFTTLPAGAFKGVKTLTDLWVQLHTHLGTCVYNCVQLHTIVLGTHKSQGIKAVQYLSILLSLHLKIKFVMFESENTLDLDCIAYLCSLAWIRIFVEFSLKTQWFAGILITIRSPHCLTISFKASLLPSSSTCEYTDKASLLQSIRKTMCAIYEAKSWHCDSLFSKAIGNNWWSNMSMLISAACLFGYAVSLYICVYVYKNICLHIYM
jgi:hypothetical protein